MVNKFAGLLIIISALLSSCGPNSDNSDGSQIGGSNAMSFEGIWKLTTPYGTINTPITQDGRFSSWANFDGTVQILYGIEPHSIAHAESANDFNGAGYSCFTGSQCLPIVVEGEFEAEEKLVGAVSYGGGLPEAFVATRSSLSDWDVSTDYLVGSWSFYGTPGFSLTISKVDDNSALGAGFDQNGNSVSTSFEKVSKNIFEYSITRKFGAGTETLDGLAFLFTNGGFKYIDVASVRFDSVNNTYTYFIANLYTSE